MPPRNLPGRGGPRAGGGGNPPSRGGRGGGAGRGSKPGPTPSAAAHRDTLAVHLKRPNFGTIGRNTKIQTNSFEVTIPESDIFHYDVVEPDRLPDRFNFELFKQLQELESNVFTPKVVYDGKKNAFAPRKLPFGDLCKRKFSFSLGSASAGVPSSRPPKLYHITLTQVNQISTEVLHGYAQGEYPHDEKVINGIMALNVVVRMGPNLKFPFNKRSFFSEEDKKPIGNGLELWRGIFQSIRPTIGRYILNVDLKTGVMFKEGPLIGLCLDFLRPPPQPDIATLLSFSPKGFGSPVGQRKYRELSKFLAGVRVQVASSGSKLRTIRGLSDVGADALFFSTRDGTQMTVAQYFHSLQRILIYPTVICVQVGATAMIPLELCTVPKGQIARKALSDQQLKDLQEFSTIRPKEKFEKIKAGVVNLNHGQSDYVQQFGMSVKIEPVDLDMRILDPPKLRYGTGSKQPTVDPRNGSWNMVDKKFYNPARVERWLVLIYDTPRNFPTVAKDQMIKSFLKACKDVGIHVEREQPMVEYKNPHQNPEGHMRAAGAECMAKLGGLPTLIIVVLPQGGGPIREAVKHFGDMTVGVPTQCLKAWNCKNAKEQYWMNVMLKVNLRLGGINSIAQSTTMSTIVSDPVNPTVVMGADVIHPAPGSKDRPSFAALVCSIDPNASRYVATDSVQAGRQENISDLKLMCKQVLSVYRAEMKNPPKRLLFYRDGVSEGEFTKVLKEELRSIKEACQEHGISPKITFIVVGKRHHNQLFSNDSKIIDKSGNCPAGSVIDTEIVHPTDFDFVLQSHAGILGTSRPGHYSVIYDDIGFSADTMQALSFGLCHTYGPATRSVSIPAPVYYADRVCSRAKFHYNPNGDFNFSDTATQVSGAGSDTDYLARYRTNYKPLHETQRRKMYFV